MGQKPRSLFEDPLLPGQAEKLFSAFIDRYRHSALGSMTKGVIHNLNGSLQILSMQIELLQGILSKEMGKANPALLVKAQQCLAQADKMKEMIEVMTQKGIHDEQEGSQPVHLNHLLEEEVSLLKHDLFFKHEVHVEKAFSSRLPVLRGYYVDFSQGLLNLIHNALEAMEGTEERRLTLVTEVENGQIRIDIKDSGCGIPEELRQNLFRPFFTTKGEGHYGLGLFTARTLLSPYGASFHFESGPGGGAEFSVLLPLPS